MTNKYIDKHFLDTIAGCWHIDETYFNCQFQVNDINNSLDIQMVNPDDGEQAVVRNVELLLNNVRFDTYLESTGRLVHHQFEIIDENKLKQTYTFTHSYVYDLNEQIENTKAITRVLLSDGIPVGTWRGLEGDLTYEYEIRKSSGKYNIAVRDFMDDEVFQISKSNYVNNILEFDLFVPSTQELGHYTISSASGNSFKIHYTVSKTAFLVRVDENKC